jgi:hypothetical protein
MSVLGFEPTYVPGQSYAPQLRLPLWLVRACAPEAVPTMMARAIAVLIDMVCLLVGLDSHRFWCVRSGGLSAPILLLEPSQWWRPTG